jgi:oligopeptide/dipeptide ABC transporter ATP-binding protein
MAPEPAAAAPLISAVQVSRTFTVRGASGRRKLQAVDGVSLAVGRAETVAVVGESGSGKSTLGRMFLDLLAPTAGRIEFEGVDISRMTRAQWRRYRREVQVVFQDTGSSLNPRRSIGSSVSLPLLHNLGMRPAAARRRAGELLDMVGLRSETFLDRSPLQLSGGQRQRVAIARAMASNPSFVVADEAVSALDVSVRSQVLRVMRDLQRDQGVSFLFITHDLGVVRAVADRVVVMYLGQVVESGSADAVLDSPAHPYTKALLAAAPRPDPTVRAQQRSRLTGEIPSPIAPPPGCRFHTRCPLAQPICREQVPPVVRFDDGLASACHFAGDVRSGALAMPAAPTGIAAPTGTATATATATGTATGTGTATATGTAPGSGSAAEDAR